MTLEEQFIEDYVEGFNHAAILADHAPELLSDITPDNNPANDYFTGFFAAQTFYQEQQLKNELDELAKLRDDSKINDKERER